MHIIIRIFMLLYTYSTCINKYTILYFDERFFGLFVRDEFENVSTIGILYL